MTALAVPEHEQPPIEHLRAALSLDSHDSVVIAGTEGRWLTHETLCGNARPVMTAVTQDLADRGLMRWLVDPRVRGTRSWLWQATSAGIAWRHSGSQVLPEAPPVTHGIQCEPGWAVVTLSDPTGTGIDGAHATVCVSAMVGDDWLLTDDDGCSYVPFRDERPRPLERLLRDCAGNGIVVAQAASRDVSKLQRRFSEHWLLATAALPLLRSRERRLMPYLREHADVIAGEVRRSVAAAGPVRS